MKTLGIAVSLLFVSLTVRGDCQAAFDAQRAYEGVPYFNDAFVADVDGDGLPDLVLATAEGTAIAHGRGGGQLGTVTKDAVQNVAAVVDVSGDALPDLVTWEATVHVNRGGAFASQISLGDAPEYLAAIGDFTNDGRADILTLEQSRLHARLYAGGTLDGREVTLQPPVNYAIARTPGDIDHDGNLDLISSGQSEKTIRIDYGNGAGDFPRTETRVIDGVAANLVVANFDGSGGDDIVFTTAAGTQIMFNGEASAHQLAVDPNAALFRVVDVDADGIADLVSYGSGHIRVYRNDGHAHFAPASELFASNFTLGDLNVDGFADFVVVTENGFAIVPGRGDGTFDTRRRELAAGVLAASGDVNGDGLDELLVANNHELRALFADGHSELLPATADGAVVSVAASGEVLLRAPHALFVLTRGDEGTWSLTRTVTRDTIGAMLADLNGDGANEIILAEHHGVTAEIKVLNDTTDAELFRADVPPRPSFSFAAGDADEDGKLDLFAAASGTFALIPHSFINRDGYLRAWFGTGGGAFGGEHVIIENESFDRPHAGDFNGDGHLDLAAVASSDLVNLLYVFSGDGHGAFVNRPPAAAPEFIGDIATGDVNGDGIDDVAAWLGNTLTLYAGGRGGLAKRGSYWAAGNPNSSALARLRVGAPMSIVFTYSDEGVIGTIDGVCVMARRRGVRH